MSEGEMYIAVAPSVELFVQDVGEGNPFIFIPWLDIYDRSLRTSVKSLKRIIE